MYLTCIYHFSLNVPVERMFENKLKSVCQEIFSRALIFIKIVTTYKRTRLERSFRALILVGYRGIIDVILFFNDIY